MRRRFFFPSWVRLIILGLLVTLVEHLAVYLRFQTEYVEAHNSLFQIGWLGFVLAAFAGGMLVVTLWNLTPAHPKPNPIIWSATLLILNLLWWVVFLFYYSWHTDWGSSLTDK